RTHVCRDANARAVSALSDRFLRQGPRAARRPLRRRDGACRECRVGRAAFAPGMRRLIVVVAGTIALALTLGPAASAQSDRIRAQRDTLERIRRERETLERQAAELQTSVHDLDAEVANLNERADATARLVRALDDQLSTINGETDVATKNVASAQKEL